MNDHLEIEIIWGTDAVRAYRDWDDDTTWEQIEELGQISKYNFNTEEELKAFIHGVDEASGWMEYYVVQPGDLTL